MIKNFDFIIVGQGLAGTTLAHIFLHRGKTVLVIDEPREITSSKVAAGVWNPVVFKKYTQSYIAPTLLAFNKTFYPVIEQRLGVSFYHPRPYYKVFSNEGDVNHWRGKLHNPDVQEFLNPEIFTDIDTQAYNAPHGSAPILDCGYVNVTNYLATSAQYFEGLGSYLPQTFDYNALELKTDCVEYKGNSADKIIFCEGLYARFNPWWSHIPFSPAKGEVFVIEAQLPENEAIVNKGVFIVPLGNNLYKVGSTYRWGDLENTITESAKAELIKKLNELINVPYTIIEHKAAVRPAVVGRRPVVGLHHLYPQMGVFNGLGSRGVMLAPFFANQFADYLFGNGQLDAEVDAKRFTQSMQ
ncbi:MAG: NAD(P)/FAD-dependent oxidoreductase [Bacteroidota bacterium]